MKVKRQEVYNADAKVCVKMLLKAFPERFSKSEARDEILRFLRGENLLYLAIENDEVIGFVGALKRQYSTAYELHMMLIKPEMRFRGVGSRLLDILEHKLINRKVHTLFFGADDEGCKTSLSETDLYEGTFDKIKDIQAIGHPYLFYQKKGYKIMGVIPDAHGIGKPDIIMAKRLYKPKSS